MGIRQIAASLFSKESWQRPHLMSLLPLAALPTTAIGTPTQPQAVSLFSRCPPLHVAFFSFGNLQQKSGSSLHAVTSPIGHSRILHSLTPPLPHGASAIHGTIWQLPLLLPQELPHGTASCRWSLLTAPCSLQLPTAIYSFTQSTTPSTAPLHRNVLRQSYLSSYSSTNHNTILS